MTTLLERTTPSHYHDHVDDPTAAGRRLRQARVDAGLSQRQLSFPGCSAAYVSRLEAGDRVPSRQLADKLAHRLNVDVVWLLTGQEDPLRSRIRFLEEALAHFGAHPDTCAIGVELDDVTGLVHRIGTCSCGLADAIAGETDERRAALDA